MKPDDDEAARIEAVFEARLIQRLDEAELLGDDPGVFADELFARYDESDRSRRGDRDA